MQFPQTEWSLIVQATLSGDAAGRNALEELCRRYWPAVKEFLSRRGLSNEDAEDVAQEFFSSIVQSGGLHSADRGLGKFRSFLLGALERSLADWWRRQYAKKRGGGQRAVPLEDATLDHAAVPAADELEFDAAWAERVLEVSIDALERDFEAQGKGSEFAQLVPFLSSSAGQDASDAAASALGVSAAALKSKIFRLRQRFRDCVLEEVSRTVETPHEAEQEMAYLFRILSAPGR